ncbi:hypothetical protein BDV10DRAFT_41718 [Aspergillus recurvatus]
MTESPRRIEDLADELISDILFFLVAAENRSPASSPVNSHALLPGLNGRRAHVYGEETELDRFRLVCKRFLRISTPRKFTSFHLRFSRRGFRRLEELMHMQLACHVRHFTYMVRPFYQESGWSQFFADDFPAAETHRARLQEQIYILTGNHDRELLEKALVAFSSLQEVKLLRLQDQADEQLLDHVRERSLEGTLGLIWEPACTRAVSSLGKALLASKCTSVRFLGPQIDPKAAVRLLQTPSAALSAIGARLACLEVTFYAKADMTSLMQNLSQVFHDLFLAAKNLEAIHLGFATAVPLGLSLDQVFHRIQWKRLRKLSIQGWRLNSQEIVALIRRHRHQLRDIRIVNVSLRDGSRWRDVLSVLHDEMDEIEHIDLREIDYVSDDAVHGVNSSNGHGSSYGISHGNGNGSGAGSFAFHHQRFLNTAVNINHLELAFALLNLPHHASIPEVISKLSVDELGDNGIHVSHEKRQIWEAWVLSSPRKIARRRN